MEYQGGGFQTGPRQVLGAASVPQQGLSPGSSTGRNPVRGYPPGRGPEPEPDAFAQGNGYSPVSGYRLPLERIPPPTKRKRAGQRGGRLFRRPVLLGAVGLVGVLALAAGSAVFYHYYKLAHPNAIHPGSSLKLPTSDPTAGSPYFSAKLGKWQHIGTRKLDPAPLTVNELYPPAFMPPGGAQYTRAAAAVDKDCTLAVFGELLQNALDTGKCTQVVRATYIAGNGKMMGTIGVINLSTATGAQRAGQVTGPDQLIAPLSTSKGPAKNMMNGTGVIYAEVKGHYLILMYAEFTNLKSPSTDAQKLQLVNFAKGMFGGSANISLSNRLLTGKPG